MLIFYLQEQKVNTPPKKIGNLTLFHKKTLFKSLCMHKNKSHSEIREKNSNKTTFTLILSRFFLDNDTYTRIIVLTHQILVQAPKIWHTDPTLGIFLGHMCRFTVKFVVKAFQGSYISSILLLYQCYLSKSVC